MKVQLDAVLGELRKKRGDKSLQGIVALLEQFKEIVYSVDKMPKIVEKVKEVIVEVEKVRPVLIPVFNSEQEIALELIIHDLVAGISKLNKKDIERNFEKELIDMFDLEFASGETGFKSEERKAEKKEGERERILKRK